MTTRRRRRRRRHRNSLPHPPTTTGGADSGAAGDPDIRPGELLRPVRGTGRSDVVDTRPSGHGGHPTWPPRDHLGLGGPRNTPGDDDGVGHTGRTHTLGDEVGDFGRVVDAVPLEDRRRRPRGPASHRIFFDIRRGPLSGTGGAFSPDDPLRREDRKEPS